MPARTNIVLWTMLLFITGLPFKSNGQARTIGLFYNSSVAYDGYTLFSPVSSRSTFLINNCGEVVNEWSSNFSPGLSAYLLEDGTLMRTAQIGSAFPGGGSGGRLEQLDWDDNLIWSFNYSSSSVQQHHDIEVLPNGNILIIAWELRTVEEAIEAGKDPSTLDEFGLWPEHIIEITPVGDSEADTVWAWHMWDHMIQDFDSTKSNFGVVSDHPELININYKAEGVQGKGPDFVHFNSIDYIPERDEIILSTRNYSEIWIIDHSTTTEEAASHSGGNSGMGGDLLFRWGNPEAYDRGTADDRRFYGQHDARWIGEGMPDSGSISVFNNGDRRPDGQYSSVEILKPQSDAGNRNYITNENGQFLPDTLEWLFTGAEGIDFFSPRLSGAHQLPNGNMLICLGNPGQFVEVTSRGDAVWNYINPVSAGVPLEQGQQPLSNNVFKIERYGSDYSAFNGVDLTPMGPLEREPLPSTCSLFPEDTTTHVLTVPAIPGVHLRGNPIKERIVLENRNLEMIDVAVYTMWGQCLDQRRSAEDPVVIPVGHYPEGMLILQVRAPRSGAESLFKVLKVN